MNKPVVTSKQISDEFVRRDCNASKTFGGHGAVTIYRGVKGVLGNGRKYVLYAVVHAVQCDVDGCQIGCREFFRFRTFISGSSA